MNYLIVKYLKH